jgi:uncharacterized protein
MVTAIDERANPHLAEVVRRLVEVLKPERIYLFGSQARGEATEDSDYDLLVVVPDTSGTDRHQLDLAYESLWGIDAAADVIVQTREQFDSRAHLRASLSGTVLREGKLLYAAG